MPMPATPRTALAACALLLAAGGALAQTPAPAPVTATPAAAAAVNATDRRYLASEARGSAFELAIAQLAQERATRQDVKDYAARMVSDHESYNTALRQFAEGRGVKLPDGLTRGDREKLERLRKLRGAAFDNAFVAEARRVNAEDVRDGRSEAKRTQDPGVRGFLERFASVDTEHQRLADALQHRR